MSFYTEVIQQSPLFHVAVVVRSMDLLEPNFRAKVQAIIADAAEQGITLFVTETYRSIERQAMLYAEHATQLQTVGVHHYGLAADFAKLVDGKVSWDGDWTFLGKLAISVNAIWGGNWNEPDVKHTFCDFDHVQGCTLAEQDLLFAGSWYPDSEAAA